MSLSFYPMYLVLPNWSYWDSTISVKSSETWKVCIGFIPKGHLFVGKITVYSSDSQRISVNIKDSLGNTVFRSVLVDGSYSFVFQSPKDDYYYFHFDNTYSTLGFSSFYDKKILWQIYYYGNYTLIFQVSGILLLMAGILCVGLHLLRSEKRAIYFSREVYKALQEKAECEDKDIEELIKEIILKPKKRKRKTKDRISKKSMET